MEITYASIKPLIKKEEVNGTQIQLEFCARNQSTPVPTVGVIMPDEAAMKKNMAKDVGKSVAKGAAVGFLSRIVGSLFGGVGGAVASSATSMAGKEIGKRTSHSSAMPGVEVNRTTIEKAVVEAFSHLSTMYLYNESTSEWEYRH